MQDKGKLDVFLSYARLDNGDSGWVSAFAKQLTDRLTSALGRRVTVWWDTRIDPNAFFDNTIESALCRAVAFVPLLSRSYLNSHWCAMECGKFMDVVMDRPVGLREAFFVCQLQDIWTPQRDAIRLKIQSPPNRLFELTEKISDTFDFFKRDDASQWKGRLCEPKPAASDHDWATFSDRLNDLVVALTNFLNKSALEQPGAKSLEPSFPSTALYRTFLAPATDRPTQTDRTEVCKALQGAGVNVYPMTPDEENYVRALDVEALTARFEAFDCFIQLVGQAPHPNALKFYTAAVQARQPNERMALKIFHACKQEDIDKTDVAENLSEAYTAIFEDVHARYYGTAESLAEGLLNDVRPALAKKGKENPSRDRSILIDIDQKDLNWAQRVTQALRAEGLKCKLPHAESEDAVVYKPSLDIFDAVVYVWNEGDRACIDRIASENYKQLKTANANIRKAIFTYTPPRTAVLPYDNVLFDVEYQIQFDQSSNLERNLPEQAAQFCRDLNG